MGLRHGIRSGGRRRALLVLMPLLAYKCAPTIVKTFASAEECGSGTAARRTGRAAACDSQPRTLADAAPSSTRTITLSAAPEPSITVTRAKPGPSG